MSDLGAIFHVKKAGVQYDAHAYTDINECPYPHINIKFKGTNAFVKLENKGSGDVPCYVKTSGGIYQVQKSATPSGSLRINMGTVSFTVPSGVNVVMITGIEAEQPVGTNSYIGVTSGKTYSLIARFKPPMLPPDPHFMSLLQNQDNDKIWVTLVSNKVDNFIISWSPEINNQQPNVTDY